MCDVHTKTAVLNALLLTRFTASPHSQCHPDPKGSLSTVSANASDRSANKAVEKAIVDKNALVRSTVSPLYSW